MMSYLPPLERPPNIEIRGLTWYLSTYRAVIAHYGKKALSPLTRLN